MHAVDHACRSCIAPAGMGTKLGHGNSGTGTEQGQQFHHRWWCGITFFRLALTRTRSLVGGEAEGGGGGDRKPAKLGVQLQ